ncbi:MAG TPA: cytochrome c [Steroidobacteraceae bacterium]|jgi:mono/diheme cytochrome c family protein|nr:cytochrome c [Steroidobacteraceae bacterium]
MSTSTSRPILRIVGALILIALLVTGYEVLGPQPTDFAGGKRIALTAYHEQNPTGVPAELTSASLIERGEYLARAADCEVCHTAEGGTPYAGGRAFVLPFGTLYSTNITPDPTTGIGGYTDANFLDAMHKGIGRDNTKLYPAMPYASYTYMSDADALAIMAYLFSLPPVKAPAPQNSLAFPFNQRSLMSVWSLLFNSDKRFEPNVERSAQWNRGAYLAEAMGHCGECHTPRNLFFALNNRQKFAGAVQAGWRAYNITPDKDSGIGGWSDADLAHYLSLGHADGRGTAAGPMGEAVDASLKFLKPDDIGALVAYLRSVTSKSSSDLPQPRANPAPRTPSDSQTARVDPHGKAVYEGACAGCHGWSGESPIIPAADLTGTRAVNDPTATNVVQVIIRGGPRHVANDPSNMPAFGSTYSDEEIASVANYVTARFGAKGSELTAANVAKLRTED